MATCTISVSAIKSLKMATFDIKIVQKCSEFFWSLKNNPFIFYCLKNHDELILPNPLKLKVKETSILQTLSRFKLKTVDGEGRLNDLLSRPTESQKKNVNK